jgi:CubicO group peptidase (beta-lactamase class C family)
MSSFNIGSINTVFTATAVRQLAAAGKLHPDSTLARYWLDYPGPEVAKRVSTRQLLQHRSAPASAATSSRRRPAERDSPCATTATSRHNRDFIPLSADNPLQFDPGTRQQYSNAGYVLLGALVERVSGEDYYGYVRRHIHEPAGMTRMANLDPPAAERVGRMVREWLGATG